MDGAISSAVEHCIDIAGVTGSIPVLPTIISDLRPLGKWNSMRYFKKTWIWGGKPIHPEIDFQKVFVEVDDQHNVLKRLKYFDSGKINVEQLDELKARLLAKYGKDPKTLDGWPDQAPNTRQAELEYYLPGELPHSLEEVQFDPQTKNGVEQIAKECLEAEWKAARTKT